MGFAEARAAELTQAITGLSPKPSDAMVKALNDATQAWSGRRRDHLSGLLKTLEPTSGNSADPWRDRADQLASDLRNFGAAVQAIPNPPDSVKKWIESNVTADSAFVAALAQTRLVAQARDEILARIALVDQQKANLEAKWSELAGHARDFDSQIKSTIDEISSLQEKAAYEAKGFFSKMTHELGDLVVKLKKEVGDRAPKGMPLPGKTYVEIATQLINYWRQTRSTFDADVTRIQQLFVQETGSVLFLFGAFRKDTDEFIHKYGYDISQKSVDEAKHSLDDFRSRAGNSSGNKTDADQFAEAAGILLTGHLNRLKQSWDSFAEKHEKKFFGPVGPDIHRALLDRDTFGDKYQRLVANDLHSLLVQWRSAKRDVIETAFEGFDSDSRSYLREILTNDLRELDAALQEEPGQQLKAIEGAATDADKTIG